MGSKGFRSWQWETLIDQVRQCCQIQAGGCWIWQLGTDKDGYPKLYIGGKHWRGNRAVLNAVTGVIGDHAMHSCDTPSCMNPDHLRWGSASDNAVDAFGKGRRGNNFRALSGERNGRAKLSDAQVLDIVERSRAGEGSPELAAEFDVSVSRIQQIRRDHGVPAKIGRPKR